MKEVTEYDKGKRPTAWALLDGCGTGQKTIDLALFDGFIGKLILFSENGILRITKLKSVKHCLYGNDEYFSYEICGRPNTVASISEFSGIGYTSLLSCFDDALIYGPVEINEAQFKQIAIEEIEDIIKRVTG